VEVGGHRPAHVAKPDESDGQLVHGIDSHREPPGWP
jgi:hypothetical protein